MSLATHLPVRAIRWAGRTGIRLTMRGLPRGPHITRYYMYRQLAGLLREHRPDARVLAISHSRPFCELLGLRGLETVEANYPDYTITALPFADNSFDYVVSDQVLEHVEGDPQTAIDETYRVLRPGGVAVHTTCFMNPFHPCPNDFWRFTPEGLRLLCKPFSLVIACGGWGNPLIWPLVWLGLRYEPVPTSAWHPVHKIAMFNTRTWPVHTWIVAEK